MANRERAKGLAAEREVAALYRAAGFEVRGLEGGGDHLAALELRRGGAHLRIHSEVKRQEVARPWAWFEQAAAETPPGSLTIVAFRRSRSPWLALVPLEPLLMELAR